MSAVRLRFREATSLPVDASPLLPRALAGRSAAELAALPLRVGNRVVPLGELAEIEPGDADTLVIEASFKGLDRLGRGMAGGRLEIYGDVGAYLGQEMRDGRIELFGSAGPFAAAGMAGGILHVTARAGDHLGGALPGDSHGMTGGAVLVGGDAGKRVGDRMRRGLIAVAGRLGDFPASRLIGGTIIGLEGCGREPGHAMRRGTLLLGRAPSRLPVTFADNGTHTFPWLSLLARHLATLTPAIALPGDRATRWTGCASTGGKGEILVMA
ncbi:formylmethanofuran dehydrogenase subunit C [Benzoatithermus flavus]|uniref:Formylmethanofuran dehydrogenase subunit C n=1 Tax=Benzoatithermus flavus TaxID=3108223 RepID=A0ABU8XPK1_9PROT